MYVCPYLARQSKSSGSQKNERRRSELTMPARRDLELRIRDAIRKARTIAIQKARSEEESYLVYPLVLQTLLDSEVEIWLLRLDSPRARKAQTNGEKVVA